MANGGYITSNLLTGIAHVDPSPDPDVAYPAANAYNGIAGKPVRWTVTAGNSITVTLTASGNCTGVALCAHNFITDGTCVIDGASKTIAAGQSIWHKFVGGAKSSCVISVRPSNSGSSYTKIMIGEIVMGNYSSFADNYSYGWGIGHLFVNDVHESEFGNITAYERWNTRTVSMPFANTSEANAAALEALWTACKGNLTPFLLIPDIDLQDCFYGRLTNPFSKSYMIPGRNTVQLEFREDPAAVGVA